MPSGSPPWPEITAPVPLFLGLSRLNAGTHIRFSHLANSYQSNVFGAHIAWEALGRASSGPCLGVCGGGALAGASSGHMLSTSLSVSSLAAVDQCAVIKSCFLVSHGQGCSPWGTMLPSYLPLPGSLPSGDLITPAAPSEPGLPFQTRSLSWLLKFNVFNHTPRGFKNQNCSVTSNETLAPLHRASTPMDGRCRDKVWHRPPHHTHTILTFIHLQNVLELLLQQDLRTFLLLPLPYPCVGFHPFLLYSPAL